MEFQLINFLIAPTLLSLMLSLGLSLTFAQIAFLWTKTRLLVKSILSVVILVPIVGILAALLLPVGSALRVVILAMAAAPGAPLTTKRVVMSGGNWQFTSHSFHPGNRHSSLLGSHLRCYLSSQCDP